MPYRDKSYQQFRQDVQYGLSQVDKFIPYQYLYDTIGCELFNKIAKHPEYYLTLCEHEILAKNAVNIISQLQPNPVNMIELGPGEGNKTRILIEECIKQRLINQYIPIDISSSYLHSLANKYTQLFPDLPIQVIQGDYHSGFNLIKSDKVNNFILFLGSSIGNLDSKILHDFFQNLIKWIKPGDFLFTGFDLIKSPHIMIPAYDDKDGITRDFNLNLLKRINHELSADFDLRYFQHMAIYNHSEQAMESYLLSKLSQVVTIKAINQQFLISVGEPIYIESSYKFTLSQIEVLAHQYHFEIIKHYVDNKGYFVDSLWKFLK